MTPLLRSRGRRFALDALDAQAAQLVRFCVAPASGARAAWEQLVAGLPEQDDDRAPYPPSWRDLLPLVAWRARLLGLEGPKHFATRLRLASVIEEKRLLAVHDLTRQLLELPALGRADPVVVGELGLGETVYPAPATRHTTRLQLRLRRDADWQQLVQAVGPLGFSVQRPSWRRRLLPGNLYLRHASGFRVDLTMDDWWERAGGLTHHHLLSTGQWVEAAGELRFRTPGLDQAWRLACRTADRDRRGGRLLWLVDAGLIWQHRPIAGRWHWLQSLAADLAGDGCQAGVSA